MIAFLCLIFGVVTLAHPPARNVLTALLFVVLVFGAMCLNLRTSAPTPVPVAQTQTTEQKTDDQLRKERVAAIENNLSESTNVVSTITSNRWTSHTLIVSGTLNNPKGWPLEIVGFDANKQSVTVSKDYSIQSDGTFEATLSDANRQIKFVEVVRSSSTPVQAEVAAPVVDPLWTSSGR
jgi:hypothetical protein